MKSKISTIKKRQALPLMTKHPEYERVGVGLSLGFCKLKRGHEWRARMAIGGKHVYKKLGEAEQVEGDGHMTYKEAKAAAEEWQIESIRYRGRYTVQQAIDVYISKLSLENGTQPAELTRARLYRHVPPDTMQKVASDLTVNDLTEWRNELVNLATEKNADAEKDFTEKQKEEALRKRKATANRTMSMLQAALNHSYNLGRIKTAEMPQWKRVKKFAGTGKGKANLLTDNQVKALINAVDDDFATLCRAGALTGARYGELVKAHVSDFNSRARTCLFRTKKGRGGFVREREQVLNDQAVELFRKITRGRPGDDYLFVKADGSPWGAGHQTRRIEYAIRDTQKNRRKADRLPAWTTFYSLRHYSISKAVKVLPLTDVADNTGTSVKMLEMTYAKSDNAFKRDRLNEINVPV
jgi:integrase